MMTLLAVCLTCVQAIRWLALPDSLTLWYFNKLLLQ